MAKKKKYYGKKKMSGYGNYNPGVFKFGNAGMDQNPFRKAFPLMPRYSGGTMDDSIRQIDYQMKEDMKPLKKGLSRSKF